MGHGSPAARLAPSPTGLLHLGNARTFLAAWVSARAQGMRVVLRIEDIDGPRVKPGLTESAIADLAWLGLDWDGEPIWQSTRSDQHRAALERLQAGQIVYPCTCSRKEIEQAASAPHADSEGPTYPGTCATRTPADRFALQGRPFAWRMRVTHSPRFQDRIWGDVAIDLARAGGDFVVWKVDGGPAYQLAVVVDDELDGVIEIVRGDDLLSSTPRQLLIREALGWQAPRHVHLPLVLGADGRRLAKRHGDISLASLRTRGVPPARVVGWLAWSLGWQSSQREVMSAEVIPAFDWSVVPREPLVLDEATLRSWSRD